MIYKIYIEAHIDDIEGCEYFKQARGVFRVQKGRNPDLEDKDDRVLIKKLIARYKQGSINSKNEYSMDYKDVIDMVGKEKQSVPKKNKVKKEHRKFQESFNDDEEILSIVRYVGQQIAKGNGIVGRVTGKDGVEGDKFEVEVPNKGVYYGVWFDNDEAHEVIGNQYWSNMKSWIKKKGR